jgi:hypothetical protein
MGAVRLHSDWHQEVIKAVLPEMRRKLARARAIAVRKCPKDTGFLSTTIYTQVFASTGRVVLGARANYSGWVEFGHKTRDGGRVPAQPFLRSSLYEVFGTKGATEVFEGTTAKAQNFRTGKGRGRRTKPAGARR